MFNNHFFLHYFLRTFYEISYLSYCFLLFILLIYRFRPTLWQVRETTGNRGRYTSPSHQNTHTPNLTLQVKWKERTNGPLQELCYIEQNTCQRYFWNSSILRSSSIRLSTVFVQHSPDLSHTPSDIHRRTTLPYKAQQSVNVVRRQLYHFGRKLNHDLQPLNLYKQRGHRRPKRTEIKASLSQPTESCLWIYIWFVRYKFYRLNVPPPPPTCRRTLKIPW